MGITLQTTRRSAFVTHLAISAVILLGLLAVIFFKWYPYDLIYAGGLEGLKILISVDLVLGPLLTLIVFSPGKKGLKKDLISIGVLQTACLAVGLWMIYEQRPLVQVLMDDGVHLLSAAAVKEYDAEPSTLPGPTPKNVMMSFPEDRSSWATVKLMTELADGIPFSFRDDLYIAISQLSRHEYEERLTLILKSRDSEELQRLNQLERSTCTWIPLASTHVTGFACHSYENGIEKLSNKRIIGAKSEA